MDSIFGYCQSYEEIEHFGKTTELREFVTSQLEASKKKRSINYPIVLK